MRRFSIKLKLTVLYSFFMILVTGSSIAILFSMTSHEILASVQNQLKSQVQNSLDDIEEEGGSLDIDSDFFTLENNVYLSVCSFENHFLYGRIPRGFPEQPEPADGELQTYRREGQTWYVYDIFYQIEDYGPVYVRGITSASQAENEFRITIRLALIFLPLLAVITAVIGYRMVRRTLLPVRDLTETVQKIQEGKDLSRRIGLPESAAGSQDEIGRLAVTFDQMMRKLDESFQREKQFTSDVSHELRTPVSVILAQCGLCLADESLTEEQREQIRLIQRKAGQMSGIISQLLLLSRADQGRQQLNREEMNLSELTELTAEEQRLFAGEKGIRIHTEIEQDLYASVDETFYIRMLINLISNAVCYGKEGGNVWVRLFRDLGKDDEGAGRKPQIVGMVCDDGIGISGEALPHIWDRFYRADSSRTDSSHSGLGLSMVQWIVRMHGGEVRAESVPGEGSVFTFTLPLAEE